ncbi:MAG: type I-C CRISPR-associated protein Cas8c/Csd1 [Rhodothermales bacterium]
MILDRLRELHARLPDDVLIPAAHKKQTVRWILNISADGRFLGFTETGKKKKDYKEFVAPYANRTSATKPFLLIDKPDYVLGLSEKESDKALTKAAERHNAYMELLDECAKATEDEELMVLSRLLRDPEQVEQAQSALRAETWKPGDLIAPRVGDNLLHRRPTARRFWQQRAEAEAVNKSAFTAECLLCSEEKPIARTHPIELLVGPDRVGLVTGNAAAFLSHGLQQSEIAPLCMECATAYGEALRFLIQTDEHHLRLTNAVWLFWTREPVEENFARFFSNPDPADVARLLKTPRTSHLPHLDANDFYALVVSSNVSRLVVRSWLTLSVPEVLDNLSCYFERQRICNRNGESPPLKLLALAGALVRDLKDLPTHVPSQLVEHALCGHMLPLNLLYQAVQRARAEKKYPVTRPRAALIKLVLLSNYPDAMIDETLTPDHPSPAYQCGRMFAVLESIQQVAISPKATLVDRFYGSASTTPAAVFGTLVRKAQAHLGKLRKTKRGLYVYFDQTLAEIASHLQSFPRTLTPEEQGLFALGFYQERHHPRKKSDPDSTTPDADTGEH